MSCCNQPDKIEKNPSQEPTFGAGTILVIIMAILMGIAIYSIAKKNPYQGYNQPQQEQKQ